MLNFAAEKPMSLRRAAEYAEVDYHTIYRWIARGINGRRLEARKIGGSLRTTKEAIDRFSGGGDGPASGLVPAGPTVFPPDYAAAMQEFQSLGMSKGGTRCRRKQNQAVN
jgi:hypothetical protein